MSNSLPGKAPARAMTRRREIDAQALKNQIRLSDVARPYTKLRQSGRTMVGLCPFHDERTASFVITDSVGLYYCHGCGAGGDVIDFAKAIHRCEFLEAIEWLSGETYRHMVPGERAQARKLERAERALLISHARSQWREGTSIAGTPAETYLLSRGIVGAVPGTLRYGQPPVWIDIRTGKTGPHRHALIAACQDVDGRIMGVQRIFLTSAGAKAPMRQAKLSLGQIRGGALRLGPEAHEIVLCEGPEDGLTLRQQMPAATVWVALGSGNMAAMALPARTKRLIIAGDNNPPGRDAVARAREVFVAKGVAVAPIYPLEQFEDFNDQLRGRMMPTSSSANA